jgi:carbonic anhydrase
MYMSCPNSNSPIDINIHDITGKCDLKCDYSFNYSDSACVATNRGDYISLSYDDTSAHPVKYNTNDYFVSEVRVYTRSLHSFSGDKTDAEYIIVHNSISGQSPLLVCVPIKISGSNSINSKLLGTIVDAMTSRAPNEDDATTVSVDDYNLNNIVPDKPFFAYSGNQPFQPCSGKVDFIVFSPTQYSCDVAQATFDNLNNIIRNNVYDVSTGTPYFYNEKGPNTSLTVGDDQIYIDCQPVGSSEETTFVVPPESSGVSVSFKDLFNNVYFQIIMGSLGFILLLVLLNAIFASFKPSGNMAGGARLGCQPRSYARLQ